MSSTHRNRRDFVLLTALCTAAYFVSYVSRVNLSATMVEMIASGFAEKTAVALALSVNAITYCLGQVICGYLSDRYRPQSVMFCGFLLSGAMNFCVAVAPGAEYLSVIWAINGFAQAMIWPPIVRILSQRMNLEEYSAACKYIIWGSALGTMTVYLISPLLIGLADFRAVFIFCGLCALAMAAVWKIMFTRHFLQPATIQKEETQKMAPDAPPERFGRLAFMLMCAAMVVIMLQGALRDGVSNWLPTLVSESFNLSSGTAILSGVLLPIFHILCTQAASLLYKRMRRNELASGGTIFAAGALCAAMLALMGDSSVVVTMLLCAALAGTMHGCNFIFTAMVPPRFAPYGHVSLISGTLNAATYIGSAVSTYGIALFSQSNGWTATFWLWAAIAAAGMAVSFAIVPKWLAHSRQYEKP